MVTAVNGSLALARGPRNIDGWLLKSRKDIIDDEDMLCMVSSAADKLEGHAIDFPYEYDW